MMLARFAFITRAYMARVGPLVTRSMMPTRSLRSGTPEIRRDRTVHQDDEDSTNKFLCHCRAAYSDPGDLLVIALGIPPVRRRGSGVRRRAGAVCNPSGVFGTGTRVPCAAHRVTTPGSGLDFGARRGCEVGDHQLAGTFVTSLPYHS